MMDIEQKHNINNNHHQPHQKAMLVEINSYLTCYLCKGYLIDATTISECLHSFCRSCIIKFLQENCYCPQCEVIINKAKPCLKLDKTLQDIVYKLVPELFVREMTRRKKFYQDKPKLASKMSPEARGEDTERTIFNPQDAISLSIEHTSDDSAPGAINLLRMQANGNGTALDESQDNAMKRYLQCPGMCRIDVLKKFVRNKYNVDTSKFHIDILYKRVPLPDHYTLIDIGYIYSWKRNEPMKFFFRITDLNKVTERFDYFDGRLSPEPVVVRPTPRKTSTPLKNHHVASPAVTKHQSPRVASSKPIANGTSHPHKDKDNNYDKKPQVPPIKSPSPLRRTGSEDIKNKVAAAPQSDLVNNNNSSSKKHVYTNITLNRDNNVEIITKFQKLSNKAGQPIGLNIINVKKTAKKDNSKKEHKSDVVKSPVIVDKPKSAVVQPPKKVLISTIVNPSTNQSEIKRALEKERDDMVKSSFLRSFGLIAKTSLQAPLPAVPAKIPQKEPVSPKPSGSSQKRKNASPMKTPDKKAKLDKKPLKIIIQPKSIHNPQVRQMVSNINQNANDMSKILKPKSADIQSLINNCKINIPSSLSITLNGDGNARTPPLIPPVKNYIEILKLPDGNKALEQKGLPCSFQKIFEESIKGQPVTAAKPAEATTKRGILDVTLQLQKKSKSDQQAAPEDKVAIPRLPPRISSPLPSPKPLQNGKTPAQTPAKAQPVPPPPKSSPKSPLASPPVSSATMHSTSLGLNYTVSVGQAAKSDIKATTDVIRLPPAKPKPPLASPPSTSKPASKNLTQSHLLAEKYKIQNLAQLASSLNFNPAVAHQGGSNGNGNGNAAEVTSTVFQQAMLKHIEHQNWLNMNRSINHQGPLMQFEKYLQRLSANQGKMLNNIKEN